MRVPVHFYLRVVLRGGSVEYGTHHCPAHSTSAVFGQNDHATEM